MTTPLYSVRMRASSSDLHISGAERIVPVHSVAEATTALINRALSTPLGPPDTIHCSSEQIDPATVQYAKLPDVYSYQVENVQEGRMAAIQLLAEAGLTESCAAGAVATLAEGAGPDGKVMRGAVLMDAVTGERLEHDKARGIRVSRMDLLSTCRSEVETQFAAEGLGHHRVLEALILSGKVLQAPGIVAELCWSDAPDYVTGYVASPQPGYQRISQLKVPGETSGGRVFFVDRTKTTLSALVDYLERQTVLFDATGTIAPLKTWEEKDA